MMKVVKKQMYEAPRVEIFRIILEEGIVATVSPGTLTGGGVEGWDDNGADRPVVLGDTPDTEGGSIRMLW
jgi:hypothetical protein